MSKVSRIVVAVIFVLVGLTIFFQIAINTVQH